MIKIVLSAVFFCFLAVTVPISYGADVCANLNNTVCCGKLSATDKKTRLCQYVVCNETGACKPAGEAQFCPVGSNTSSTDTCSNATATTHTPTGTTQNKNASTAAPPKNSTAAPGLGTTQTQDTTQDTCAGLNKTECCAMQNAQNVSLCQFMWCKANVTGACFNKSKTVAEICGVAPATGEDKCNSTTTTTTAAPTPTPTNKTVTTQAPKCEVKTDNPSCCAFKIGNVSCEWVNCTDATATTKVHTGCHSHGENLTNVCVKDTRSNLCKGNTSTSTPAPSTSTSKPKPTGGAQPSKGDKDQGRHFDGASFIGGIVLCAGLVAIGFFGLKFYRARTERNYHTLH